MKFRAYRCPVGKYVLLVPKLPDKFDVRQDVPFHGPLEFALGDSGFEIRFGLQGIEFEEVAVDRALGRTWPVVTYLSEIIAPLTRAVG